MSLSVVEPVAPQTGRFGRVISNSGAGVVVLLDERSSATEGLQMGALVKIELRGSTVYGLVGELSIPAPMPNELAREMRLADVHLLGEAKRRADGTAGVFRRGVSDLPSLDDAVLWAAEADVRLVYALPGRETIRVGTIHQTAQVPAQIDINEMLGKHFAVLGTTGTGKSCSVTLILKQVLATHPGAHIVMLDPHGEYGKAFGDTARYLNVVSLALPYWIFNFDEFVEVVFGAEAPDRVIEIQYLRHAIVVAKRNFAPQAGNLPSITADTPVPYSLGELDRLLDEAMGKLENQSEIRAYLRIKARLLSLRTDPRFSSMFPKGLRVADNLTSLIGDIFRVPVDGKPMTVIDLTGVPSEVLNVVVAVLARMAFDIGFCSRSKLPVLMVCEEAHRYAPQDRGEGFVAARQALGRIAKEGRKYGLGLCIVTQRPSELDATLLSQCGTVFALRMTARKDQEIIEAALSEFGADLMSALPVLGTAEAIVTGEGVPVPMRLRFDELPPDQQPRSSTAQFSHHWQNGDPSPEFLADVISYWRHHRLRS